MDLRREIIRLGTWRYDGDTPQPVRVLRQNFDPYFWPEEGDKPEDERLNERGETYTVAFGELREGWWFASERAPVLTEAEAVTLAEELAGAVEWEPEGPPQALKNRAVEPTTVADGTRERPE